MFKVVMKLKHSICCGFDAHKMLLLQIPQLPIQTENPNIRGKLFQLSTRISRSFKIALSRIIIIVSAGNPLESIGFLILIILETTVMYSAHILKDAKTIKGKKTNKNNSK